MVVFLINMLASDAEWRLFAVQMAGTCMLSPPKPAIFQAEPARLVQPPWHPWMAFSQYLSMASATIWVTHLPSRR